MKKAIAIILSLMFVFAVAGMAVAADEKKAAPAPAAAPAAEKKDAAKEVAGDVTAVDAKANTITVKGKDGDVVVICGKETKITAGKDAKTFADIKVGGKVAVKYAVSGGKNNAQSVDIQAAAAAAPAPAAAPAKAPAPAPAKAPAEKK